MQKEKIIETNYDTKLSFISSTQNKTYKWHKPIITVLVSATLLSSIQNVVTPKLENSKEIIMSCEKNGNNNMYLGEYNAINTQSGMEVFSMEKIVGLNTINEISKLSYNWNGNNADPFSESLVKKSINVLNSLEHEPEIYPTACNSIQFEYEKESGEYLEFEIFENYINVYMIHDDESEEEFTENDIDKIKKLVNEFYGKQHT